MKKEDRFPLICLLIFAIVFLWAAISPNYRQDWFMESILSLLALPVLILTYKKFRFSNISYALILIFLILQAIGAHYTYAETPLGFWISNLLHFTRNHYDRIVHFFWGFLLYLPTLELCNKFLSIKSKNLLYYLLPASILIALGAMFEVLEWLAAIVTSPQLGTAYLGTQGDLWDTQKDLLMKVIGSTISALFYFFKFSKVKNL